MESILISKKFPLAKTASKRNNNEIICQTKVAKYGLKPGISDRKIMRFVNMKGFIGQFYDSGNELH